jgi:hypothetical protein
MSFDVKFASKTEALQAVRSLITYVDENFSDANQSTYVRQQLYALHTLLFHVPETPRAFEELSLAMEDHDFVEVPF